MSEMHWTRARETYLSLGILAGDNIIVQQASKAEPGALVVALIDGVASVRRCEPWMQVMGRVLEVSRRIA